MSTTKIRKLINYLMISSVLCVLVFSVSMPLYADTTEDIIHLLYYTSITEETTTGDKIVLDNRDIHAVIAVKSSIRITFDEEKLFEVAKYVAKEGGSIVIRIEAYVKPQKADRYPISVDHYSTVIRKTETSQEMAVPGSGDTTITKLARTEYEVHYCQKTLQLAHPEQEEITRTIPDTYIDLASRDLVDGDRVYITISDTKNNYHINKILEVKQFGLEVYFTTPIMLAYRPSTEEGTVLAPSPGTSVIFKIVRRRKTLFEDWLHPAINIAFLDFDPKQSIEIGLGVGLSIYKDFFEIGYGYNLSVADDSEYWYIGMNIIRLPGQK